jgi:hypothetical protein
MLALGAAWPLAAQAYRPFNSTDAAVAERGTLELEFGPLGYLVEGPNRTLVTPSLVLNWGFADRWELVLEGRHLLELGSDIQEPRLRVEDTALSLKHVWREGSLQERTGPSLATEVSALLPTIHGESGAGAEATVIVSQRWPDLTVHVNGAAAWTRSHSAGFFGGVILEGHDAWRVRPVAELFAERERGMATTISGLVGAIWRVSDQLSLDAAVRRARSGALSTTEFRLGLTWGFSMRFPR